MYWDPFTLSDGRWYQWHLAGAEIAVCRNNRFWQAYCRKLPWNERGAAGANAGGDDGPVQEVPGFFPQGSPLDAAVWDGDRAALRPGLPEKPFLLNLGGLTILPGTETTLELELPPVFRFVSVNDETGMAYSADQTKAGEGSLPYIIFSFTPFELKETWFGRNTMEGALCSSLNVPVSACVPSEQTAPSKTNLPLNTRGCAQAVIHCSMLIRNRAKTVLKLDNVPLYTSGLAVYAIDGKLQSDAPVVEVSGNDFRQTGQVFRTEQGVLLTPPVSKNTDGLIYQGTQIIKNLTGLQDE